MKKYLTLYFILLGIALTISSFFKLHLYNSEKEQHSYESEYCIKYAKKSKLETDSLKRIIFSKDSIIKCQKKKIDALNEELNAICD